MPTMGKRFWAEAPFWDATAATSLYSRWASSACLWAESIWLCNCLAVFSKRREVLCSLLACCCNSSALGGRDCFWAEDEALAGGPVPRRLVEGFATILDFMMVLGCLVLVPA